MPPRRKTAAALAALGALLAFTVFRPAPTPGPIERDFEAYYAAGVTANAGADPYSRAIWVAEQQVPGVDAGREEVLPFVGPAASLPLWSLLARLPYPVAAAIWAGGLCGALFSIAAAGLRLAGAPRDPWLYGLAAAFTLGSSPVVSALGLGQAALVSAAGVAAATAAYRGRRTFAAVGATLFAAFQPNLALVLLARLRSRWDVAIAATATAGFAALTFAAGGGTRGFAAYLARLTAHSAAERDVAIQHTPAAIAYAFGLPLEALPPFAAASTFIAVAAGAFVIVRKRLAATRATLLACALLPLAVPFFHQPDFVLELLPLLVLAVRATGRARTLGAVAAILILVDWFGLAQRTPAQGQIVCLGLVVAAGFAGMRGVGGPLRRSDLAGLATLALVAAVAVPLGRADPAPIWPDTLPRGFNADPRAGVSGVWAAEQRAAGLTARDPLWGALRAVPLTGCVVLAVALLADARRRRRPQATRRDAPAPPTIRIRVPSRM